MPQPHPSNQDSSPAAVNSWASRWGLLLRMARQVEGLSLGELAARSGLSKGYLSKLESAHHSAANPSRATLAALAHALPSTLPLIQHLAPDAGLPAARSLVAGQWNGVEAGLLEEASSEGLVNSWTEWEILLALVVLEGAGFGPPTQAMLEHACKVEASLAPFLEALEQRGVLRKIPPAQVGGAVRYTSEGMRLDTGAAQRPAHLFMQAAMNLLLGVGIQKDDRAAPSPGRSASSEHSVR